MKIKMLTTRYDNDIMIWKEGVIYNVNDKNESYYRIKYINDMWYCVNKKTEGIEFVKVGEKNE